MPQVLLLSIETRIIQGRGELDVRVSNIPFPVLVGSSITIIHPDICFAATVTIRTVFDVKTLAKTSVPQSLSSQIPLLPGDTRARVEFHLVVVISVSVQTFP